uniref:H(+)-exporting diphosphatase n=1 Tax=Phaeomonas parva TaxID=124430 RepID=A0A7S1U8P2_9STRA|mmetsp:Transcript_37056/g.115992  ORF Transcript_37056/g.115992 Transcript_37056/m.115992 type:complete len:559 (+) Transcript_37056:157-1833(+)|eukprot:CAMPEP_0118863792 /NCGR_PEP_ID=MMETSP1163-20130328/8540_1 /TAXON_ID=124430 /ORGANISM="Phaeomonas parva, Strain CCMP2877" /LENGTH=558 /DNA_ID=CAMNT_0006797829 /DNA_START=110 /DNA_END=1786 /DNA_ORIENTATION=-
MGRRGGMQIALLALLVAGAKGLRSPMRTQGWRSMAVAQGVTRLAASTTYSSEKFGRLDELPPVSNMEQRITDFLSIPTLRENLTKKQTALDEPGVSMVIRRLEKDLDFLDQRMGRTSQLNGKELSVLLFAATAAFVSPLLFTAHVTEVILPALAATVGAIGVSAEYNGKVAVSEGKEVAAVTLQAAAEAEQLLARSERVKAVMPLTVGITAACAAFSLLAPSAIEEFALKLGNPLGLFWTDLLILIWPFIGLLAAAVGGVASEECSNLATTASGVGDRRLATRNTISRTWLSGVEMVKGRTGTMRRKWVSFALGVLPGPMLGVLVPASLGAKAVIVSATAAAQAAYYLTRAEYDLSIAVDKIAEKTRCAALADVYANQSMRAGAILPFTSALGGLCIAGCAAVVEFQPVVGIIFPALGALFAAAASVSKAQCEVDTAAACAAATDFSDSNREPDEYRGNPRKNIFRNMRLSLQATYSRGVTIATNLRRIFFARFGKWFGDRDDTTAAAPAPAAPEKSSDRAALESSYKKSPEQPKQKKLETPVQATGDDFETYYGVPS